MALLDATTVEKDVNSMAIGENSRGKLSDGFVRRKVRNIDCCFAAEFLYCVFCLLIGSVALERA